MRTTQDGVLVGSVLTDGKNCWRVNRFDRHGCWISTWPKKPKNEAEIIFTWPIVNTLKIHKEAA